MFSIFTEKTLELSLMCVFVYILSVCYICLPWLVMQELYFMGEKGKYIFLLLTIVMLSDSGAYFCGVLFGKRKLAPRLSPNKTIEGALGGILFGVLGAIVLDSLFNVFFQSTGKIVLLGIVCSIAGILGDLMESTFKRFSGVKDSGKLLPGHGGILDRVDSLLFAAPVLLVFIYLFER
jgi:phosphatidate cytidylyltransferase